MLRCLILFFLGIMLFANVKTVLAQEATDGGSIELGQEYSEYNKGRKAAKAQPQKTKKSSCGENKICPWAKHNAEALRAVALYIPHRIVDFLDIFRVDVGVGPSVGAVMRISKAGQMGYRSFNPGSLRLGLRGREIPVFVETHDEYGIGPAFENSPDRKVTDGEVGAGVDLFLAGAYVGVSLDEFVDFILGIFTIDPSGDDF